MNSATWIIAIFTIVLAVFTGLVSFFTYRLWQATQDYTRATKDYAEATKRLLKQSRNVFISDAFSKIVFSAIQLTGNSHTESHAPNFASGMVEALDQIDSNASTEIKKALRAWAKSKGAKTTEWLFKDFKRD